MTDTISINGVEFTPLPKDKLFTWVDKQLVPVRYKYDYVQISKDINDPSCWPKKFPNVPPGVTREQIEQSIYRSLILSDLFFIVYFVMGVKIANHPYVIWRCQDEENRTHHRTLDIHARGMFKSTIKTVAKTVQYHLKNPDHCTCIFSYKRPAAEDFLDSVRLTYEKPIVKFAFPDVVYERPAVEAHSWSLQNGIVLRRKNTSRKEATVEASGIVEGMAMGKHFERRVYDDALETADIADSPDELNKAYSRFEMSAYLGMGLDSDFEEVIGTFYTQNGPYVRLKEKVDASGNPFYHAKIIPGSHNGLREGIPIFLSQQKFDDEKTKIHFDAQILCDPTPKDKRKLNPEFLNEIEPVLIPKNLVKVMLVDPAGDDKGKGGCDWAYMVVGIQPKLDELGLSNVYILSANIEELQEAEAPELIARMYISSGMIKAIGVEKVAQSTTEIHIANILKQHGRRISTEDGSLIILSPKGRQKDRRIVDNMAWPLNNGKIHISKSVPARVRDRLKEESTKFPYWKKDGIDCLSYLWDMIKEIDFSFYEDDTAFNYNPVGFTRKTGVA